MVIPVKYWIRIDDSLDIFAEHAVAGMIGLMANAIFGADYIVGLDGVNTGSTNPTTGTGIGGWVIGNYRQFYIQLAYIVATTGYAFVMSAIIAFLINFIPGLHLRASEEAELLGMDDDQIGEFAYDYVEVRRDYLAWTPSKPEPMQDEHGIPPSDCHGIPEHSAMLNVEKTNGIGEDSVMLNGEKTNGDPGSKHTAIGGDRHSEAAEKAKRNA